MPFSASPLSQQQRLATCATNPMACLMPRGIYIHVPFCVRKCRYCAFYSFPGDAAARQAYTDALVKEIRLTGQVLERLAARGFAREPVTSLYFGGGTPSLLPLPLLQTIFAALRRVFVFSPDCEITLEANPGTDLATKLSGYRELGINRLSLGVQTGRATSLELLGRIHSFDQVVQNVQAARSAGFRNISLDLMFGLPGETFDQFQEDLSCLMSLSPQHLSFYSLQVEAGTPLGDDLLEHPAALPAETLERAMYHHLLTTLPRAGLTPYEISNAAQPGYSSRHNSLYWRAEPYFAFGPGAASYFLGVRRRNRPDFGLWQEYLEQFSDRNEEVDPNFPLAPISDEWEYISFEEAQREFMMLGFRFLQGPDAGRFEQLFGTSYRELFSAPLADLAKRGLITVNSGQARATRLGLDLLNQIALAFI